ncbi:MAG: M20 family metallopeptidase [Pyramidobacter sp.]|nr:M20 family metallopeptidase [Pyramidobacter sp.]
MNLKEKIASTVDRIAPELIKLSHDVHDNPELGMQEFKACAWQVELLRKHGFTVEEKFCGIETAYKAWKGTPGKGPQIAFLAEYDALAGMGHACGHNTICASSCGAAISLAEALEGQEACVFLFGTPAEETLGCKVAMTDAGAFDHVDCAMMMHPAPDINLVGRGGLACTGVNVEFFGKAAHSSTPMKGINALASTIALFNAVNAQLHLWPNKSKCNGIITAGGTASNIIPDYSACRFTLRAERKNQILPMYDDMVRLANAAAAMTGAKVKIEHDTIMAERYCNRVLDEAFAANMETLGEHCQWPDPKLMNGSSDIGNVSLVVPAIHVYLTLKAGVTSSHTPQMREAARSERGDQVVLLAAKGLAMTGADVFEKPELRKAMREEYEKTALPNKC